MTRHIIVAGKSWPERYFTGTNRLQRARELIRRRTVPKMGLTNRGGARRKSRWTQLFHSTYPNLHFDKNAIAKRTGIPRSILDTVYDRGLKAWQTSGSRPGTSAPQWATARVYKFVLVTERKAPNTRYDPNQNLRDRFLRGK
jgi:hypothetical protein